MALDMDKLQEFLGRFVSDLGATVAAGNVVIGHRLGLYSNVFKKTHLVDGSDLIPDRLCGKAIPFLQGNPATDSRNLYSFVPLNPNGFDQRPWLFSPDCTRRCSSQQRHPEAQ